MHRIGRTSRQDSKPSAPWYAISSSCSTSPEAIDLVRVLFRDGKSDTEIAAELNRRELRTGVHDPWTVPAVQRVRYDHGLARTQDSRRTPDRRVDGLYSIHGIAARFDVRPGVVRYWVRRG